jgi:hypothetical protein
VGRARLRRLRSMFLEFNRGRQRTLPATWPAETHLAQAADGSTVLMFAHPDCPCTRASLTSSPSSSAMPEVDGVLGRRRRSRGCAVRRPELGPGRVYDHRGARFSGGITGLRGHVGDNIGLRPSPRCCAARPAARDHAVFGCATGGR